MAVVEKTLEAPVTFTESAIKQLLQIQDQEKISNDHGLRVGVKGGGCSGFSYVLGFDERNEKDEVYQIGGLTVLMEKAHAIYLIGMQIDWLDGLNNRGFSFVNPNAKETCGCGTSFSA